MEPVAAAPLEGWAAGGGGDGGGGGEDAVVVERGEVEKGPDFADVKLARGKVGPLGKIRLIMLDTREIMKN